MGQGRDGQTDWLEIDAFSNAMDFLRQGVSFLSRLRADPLKYKWATLCFSGALYGFLVSSLEEGDHSELVKKRILDRPQVKLALTTLQGEDGRRQAAKSDMVESILLNDSQPLLNFDEALQKVLGSEGYNRITGQITPALPNDQIVMIKKLRQVYRNEFEHFRPISWSIHKSEIVPLLEATIRGIERLVENGEMVFKMENWEEINTLCTEAHKALDAGY